jgi:diadenosine tetraphosphate (Ap4A) HIT family hydrolase
MQQPVVGVLAKKARAASGRSYRTTSHRSFVVNESHAISANDCPLCQPDAAEMVLWSDNFCRVIWVDDDNYPGFCRVILNAHVKEMTDLLPAERLGLMGVVFAVETAVREIAQPDKINLASLGNVVPHLHWHVIPRWATDPNFPDAIWAASRRPAQVPMPAVNLRQLIQVRIQALLSTPE